MFRRRLILAFTMIVIAAILFFNIKAKRDRQAALSGSPNILVILVDALRRDHLGAYGYDLPISPNLDELAEDSIVFENAFAQSHSTFLSVPSLFTSLFPLEAAKKTLGFFSLREEVVTLAERLSRAGYLNAAFSVNAFVHPDYGFSQGFNTFFQKNDIVAEELTDEMLSWLEKHPRRPFFIYMHYMDPHSPYTPPEEFRAKFVPQDYRPPRKIISRARCRDLKRLMRVGFEFREEDQAFIKALYDAEIASADRHIGRMLERLRQMDLYDDTVILLLADHGEEFWDHGDLEHGRTLYDEIIRVPLLLKLPASAGRKGERVSDIVELLDVHPTLMELTGLPPTPGIRGKSLLEVDSSEHRWGYAEALGIRTLREDGWKLIDKPDPDQDELYNLKEDPAETRNLIAKHPKIAIKLRSHMVDLTQVEEPPKAEAYKPLDPKTEKRLRALGYID
ncbi:MAG: sulfatase-like hydrolase/transferase [Armatimonadetes bacterium]|nr:sulfatase-like hydrolase/transferase [Armatimonadota bacterium]NIO97645.1 sulfatase-like hydrolase/transferase [Armatimonadota bacterium]